MSGALRAFTIGLTAFLTVVDLFATQAILPSLAAAYGERFAPPALLQEMAKNGQTFYGAKRITPPAAKKAA